MKVYIVINNDELESSKVIQGVFLQKQDAINFWECFRSNRFHYEITEHEAEE